MQDAIPPRNGAGTGRGDREAVDGDAGRVSKNGAWKSAGPSEASFYKSRY